MPDIENMTGTYDDNLDIRVEFIEAKFEFKSSNIADVTVEVVNVMGNNVPTEAWSEDITDKVNAIKTCLVDHDLMDAS